jgi:hypothetical protein
MRASQGAVAWLSPFPALARTLVYKMATQTAESEGLERLRAREVAAVMMKELTDRLVNDRRDTGKRRQLWESQIAFESERRGSQSDPDTFLVCPSRFGPEYTTTTMVAATSSPTIARLAGSESRMGNIPCAQFHEVCMRSAGRRLPFVLLYTHVMSTESKVMETANPRNGFW